MQYALLVYETEAELARRMDPSEQAAYMAPYQHYVDAMREAGVLIGGEGLKHPHTATTVRVEAGNRRVQDGPIIHSEAMLGGFFVIEVADLDAAIAWAERCPSAGSGAVEVRPIGIEG